MPTIVFNISNGAAPFIAEVIGEGLPIQYISADDAAWVALGDTNSHGYCIYPIP